jgi:hypothetical protein
MRRIRTRSIALLAALALVGAAPIVDGAASGNGSAHITAAKTCGSGYTSASIGGSHKCLRRGQFCSRAHKSEYPKYGYHCNKRDANGRYHLS